MGLIFLFKYYLAVIELLETKNESFSLLIWRKMHVTCWYGRCIEGLSWLFKCYVLEEALLGLIQLIASSFV